MTGYVVAAFLAGVAVTALMTTVAVYSARGRTQAAVVSAVAAAAMAVVVTATFVVTLWRSA